MRTGPSLGLGEKVLFTADAVHKKSVGAAWFTNRRALWLAADAKAAVQRVEVTWAAVKSFQVGSCSYHISPLYANCMASGAKLFHYLDMVNDIILRLNLV